MILVPNNVGRKHLTITGFTGWDRFIPLLPVNWQRRIVARKWLRNFGSPKVVEAGQFTFSLPGVGTFEIIDAEGNTKRAGE